MNIFPDASAMDMGPLVFMMCVYGYILMNASKTISDGSELLLLIYGPGIVGGLLIPILGAVPDCAIILISGLGPGTKAEIQTQLSVGVGTLVGSTIMLLTVPWGLSIYLGRKTFDEQTGEARESKPGKRVAKLDESSKYSLTKTCVSLLPEISETAKTMMVAALSYLIIQIPAFFYSHDKDSGSSEEAPFAMAGMIVTMTAFIVYCYYQIKSATNQELTKKKAADARKVQMKQELTSKMNVTSQSENIFRKHDKNKNNELDMQELQGVLEEMGLKTTSRTELVNCFNEFTSKSASKTIDLAAFKSVINQWIKEGEKKDKNAEGATARDSGYSPLAGAPTEKKTGEKDTKVVVNKEPTTPINNDEDNDEDEEEDEEDLHLEMTNSQIVMRACVLLLAGTLVCTFVSDPMVDVIGTIGAKLNISPFYISFVVTPVASNASEVLSGLIFAGKKTKESISLSLSTLHGAATMNSTLALSIFMALVYFRGLSWSFGAEVVTVLIVIIAVGLNSLNKNIFLWQAIVVSCFYPLSIICVYVLENYFGMS